MKNEAKCTFCTKKKNLSDFYPHELGGYCVSFPKTEISKHCDKCKIEKKTKVKSEKVCMYY